MEVGETKVVTMDGKRGEVQRVRERSYIVTIGEHQKTVLTPPEVWQRDFEHPPHEIAFGLMLDYLKLNSKI